MSWHHIYLTQEKIAASVYDEIVRDFRKAFITYGKPSGAWLLNDKVYSDGEFKHSSDLNIYLSPEASRLIPVLLKTYNVQECDEPDFTKLVISAGDLPSYWSSNSNE